MRSPDAPRGGRPLRFLGATLGGWVVLRAGVLWPAADAPLIRVLAPPALAQAVAQAVVRRPPPVPHPPPAVVAPPPRHPVVAARARRSAVAPAPAARVAVDIAAADRDDGVAEVGAIAPPLRPVPVDPARRLSASVWAIARQGSDGALPGGQLGGSQAGVRIAYALGSARRVALAARVSTPLAGAGREAALGIELRAPRLPLRVIAEQRIALDGGRGGTALYVVGGTAPVPVAAGFRLEGYAQAGVVIRDRAHGFADGAARMTRAVSRSIDLGIGTWGGAQPGAARVDVGPTIGVALPVAGRRVRVAIDWRQRVAGRARPGSGPALSIGSDF